MAVVSATLARVAGSDAAEPMAKTTDLYVKVAVAACRNSSLILLVEA